MTKPSLHDLIFVIILLTVVATSGTLYSNPTSGHATSSVEFDGGFGGPNISAGLNPLPFTLTPPIQFNRTINGNPPDSSHAEFGAGYYFNNHLFEVPFAGNSLLTQSASSNPHSPASFVWNWDSTFQVGTWTGLTGFFRTVDFSGFVPEGGFVAANVSVNWEHYLTNDPNDDPANRQTPSGQSFFAGELEASFIITRPNPPQEALDYLALHPVGPNNLNTWITTDDGNFSLPAADLRIRLDDIRPQDSGALYGYMRMFGSAQGLVFDPGDPAILSFSMDFAMVPEPSSDFLALGGALAIATYVAAQKSNLFS